MKKCLGILALLVCGLANAQEFNFTQPALWSNTPVRHEVDKKFANASAVGIADDRQIEYVIDAKDMYMLSTFHKIIKINDDKGVEMYNKIYIPVSNNGTISQLKARTITSSGKVINLPEDKIKEIDEDGRKYKLFAMEGVEKGAEVEYFYVQKKDLNFFGMEVFQGGNIPYQKATFSLTVPKHLRFDAKGFNGFAVSADSVVNEKRMMVGYGENIPEMDDEKYAVRDPYLARVEYKLSYNLANSSSVRLYTWKEFAKKVYEIYTNVSPKEEKSLQSFVDKIKIGETIKAVDKIQKIEDYIKTNINIDKNLVGEDINGLERIIKSKNANTEGIIKLFATVFDKSGVNYQIVFPSKRDDFPIDEDIENWNRIDETVFFFPESGKYISPSSVELRYPFIPAYWAGGRGLFLKGTTIGSFKTAIGSFGDVEMEPLEMHAHNMEVSVRFDKTLDTLLVKSKQILTGYGAASYRPIYVFLPKDKQDEANKDIIKSVAKSSDISNVKVENSLLTDMWDNKPLIIGADIKSTELIEKAGNKILLKVGELIGPQEQMYQEKPRQLPAEMPYPHVLERKITLEIPTGYTVKNPSDINMKVEYKDANEATMGFVSNYTQAENVITIIVKEVYAKMQYPLSQFEDFRKVINAAADFNKIVLVLEKKS
jgi:hypothetical protein